MPDRKLGAAVLGAGWVAGEHVKGYLANSNVELRALACPFQEELDKKKAQYRLDCDLLVGSAETLAERDDVDLVSICTISNQHAKQAALLAQAGKHVLIEKPMATTLDDLRLLRDAVHAAGVRAMAGFVVRFYQLPVLLKKLVDDGAIGEIIYASIDYWHDIHGAWKVARETAGNALLMGGCHAVDAIRWYLGAHNDVVEIHAYSSPPRWRHDFEYDPTFVVNLKFANGAVGRVATSLECNMPYVLNIELEGTRGAIRNDDFFDSTWPGLKTWVKLPVIKPDSPDVTHHPFPEELAYFVDCILKDVEPMTGIHDAYKTHEICLAAEISAHEGRPVELPLPERKAARKT
jgi:predicted dehydrogenase